MKTLLLVAAVTFATVFDLLFAKGEHVLAVLAWVHQTASATRSWFDALI